MCACSWATAATPKPSPKFSPPCGVSHPALAPGRVVAEQITSFDELMQAMAPASSVVATRYHNVMCALKLGKPAISLGYSDKNVSLMEDMGLPEFCQHANDISFDRLSRAVRETREKRR